jgi:acyl transferase domain-containing protein
MAAVQVSIMSDTMKFVLEQIASGTIDKQIGLQLVKRLRANEGELKAEAHRHGSSVAIIGMSLKLPMADHYDMFWKHLIQGTSCIRELPERRRQMAERLLGKGEHFEKAGYLSEIDGFDYPFFRMSLGEARLLDPAQRIFLQTAWSALEDAGYGGKKLSGSRTGVFIGYNAWPTYGTILSRLHPEAMTVALPGNIAPIIASRLNHLLDLRGPSMAIDTSCSSSLVALHTACQSLLNGECETAIAGGIKLNILPVNKDFKIGIESGSGITRTFDDAADGTLWGEGSAAVLLKPLEQAMRDNDHIYAVIKGSAINHDGSSIGLTAPNALAQERLLVEAWERAGIDPETISYIEAHGTGTKLGDPIEIDGITRAFRRYTNRKQFCGIGSAKSVIGHLDGASGIASLIKAVLCLTNKQLPPTLSFARPNRSIRFEESPLYVNDELRDWKRNEDQIPLRCGVSSFGFSGTNCHFVLEEAPSRRRSAPSADQPLLLTISAREKTALSEYVTNMLKFIVAKPNIELADVCYSANIGRDAYSYRLAFTASSRAEMIAKLERAAENDSDLYREANDGLQSAGLSVTVTGLINSWHQSERKNLQLLERLAACYAKGATIPWEQLYAGENRSRTPLPTYPFQSYSCWFELPDIGTSDGLRIDLFGEQQRKLNASYNEELEAPTNREQLEEALCIIWKEVLGLSEVSLDDHFFDLGGHSILAVRMESKLNDIGFPVHMLDFQQYSTIRLLAGHLSENFFEKTLHP